MYTEENSIYDQATGRTKDGDDEKTCTMDDDMLEELDEDEVR